MLPAASVSVGIITAVFSQGAAKDLLYASIWSCSAPVNALPAATNPVGIPIVVVNADAILLIPTFCNSVLLLATSLIALWIVLPVFLKISAGKAVKLPNTGINFNSLTNSGTLE